MLVVVLAGRDGEYRAARFAHDLIGDAAPDQAGERRPGRAGQHDQVGGPCGRLPCDRQGHMPAPGIHDGRGGPRAAAGPPPARPRPGRASPGRTWRRCAAAGRRFARGPGTARRWPECRSAPPPPAPSLTRPVSAPGLGSGARGICRCWSARRRRTGYLELVDHQHHKDLRWASGPAVPARALAASARVAGLVWPRAVGPVGGAGQGSALGLAAQAGEMALGQLRRPRRPGERGLPVPGQPTGPGPRRQAQSRPPRRSGRSARSSCRRWRR